MWDTSSKGGIRRRAGRRQSDCRAVEEDGWGRICSRAVRDVLLKRRRIDRVIRNKERYIKCCCFQQYKFLNEPLVTQSNLDTRTAIICAAAVSLSVI
jgi:hypothetical protein